MNLTQAISELRAQLAAIDQAIAAVGRIAHSRRKPRGRPPAWAASGEPKPPARRKPGRPRKQ